MNYNSRRMLTPVGGASRKRKEMEASVSSTSSKPPTAVTRAVSFTTTSSPKGAEQQPLAASNRLLAGYMAYEFLTQGKLFGQKLEPEEKRNKPSQLPEPTAGKSKPKPQSYVEVANLMKSNRAHIPGIINPTQLARWIQM